MLSRCVLDTSRTDSCGQTKPTDTPASIRCLARCQAQTVFPVPAEPTTAVRIEAGRSTRNACDGCKYVSQLVPPASRSRSRSSSFCRTRKRASGITRPLVSYRVSARSAVACETRAAASRRSSSVRQRRNSSAWVFSMPKASRASKMSPGQSSAALIVATGSAWVFRFMLARSAKSCFTTLWNIRVLPVSWASKR